MINTKEISPLKQIVLSLPESPGIYQYLNEKEEIIYVGKAKNLKRRVSSYFNKEQQSVKTKVLVKQIHDIKYIPLYGLKHASSMVLLAVAVH